MKLKIHFNHREELWNSWSHSGGIVLGVVFGTIFLVWCSKERSGWATAGVILYLVGMLFSYITSTVYHALSAHSVWKERLRKWDHAAIYWHIAGSYSPITLIALRNHGAWGWGLFVFVWFCAILGTISSFRKLRDHSNLETLTFNKPAISPAAASVLTVGALNTQSLVWIFAEGVMYITGALFYSLNKRKYMHTVFHFFVLAGSICHIIAVWGILMEYL